MAQKLAWKIQNLMLMAKSEVIFLVVGLAIQKMLLINKILAHKNKIFKILQKKY